MKAAMAPGMRHCSAPWLPWAIALFAGAMAGCGAGDEGERPSPKSGDLQSSTEWVPPLQGDALKRTLRMSPVPPVPADPTNRVALNGDAAELGRYLFHSRKLSKGGATSCAKCHDPRDSFVDGKVVAEGVLPLERHTPTLWNVAHQRWFFWDGRADSLWAQALVPIEDPLEHAFTRSGVAKVIHGDPAMRALYEATFGEMPPFDDDGRFPPEARPVPPDDRAHHLAAVHAKRARALAAAKRGVDPKDLEEDTTPGAPEHHTHLYGTGFYHPHQRAWDSMSPEDQDATTLAFVNAGKAIAAFQGRMVSARAPFDVFVEGLRTRNQGKIEALSPSSLRGLELFVGKAQCVVCHHGPLFTDYEFHDTRVPVDAAFLTQLVDESGATYEVPMEGAPPPDLGRVHGIERLRQGEFGVGSRWSDDPDGPMGVKVDYLPSHLHEGSPEFKTPTLRNVGLTAPYMHNGSMATLEEVVEFYNTRKGERPFGGQAEKILQPLGLSDTEVQDLVAFLHSLTDDSLDRTQVSAPH